MATIHLYCDGSVLHNTSPRSAGGGLAMLCEHKWTWTAFSFDHRTDSAMAELETFARTVEHVLAMAEDDPNLFKTAIIYTDCAATLDIIEKVRDNEDRGRVPDRSAIAEMIVRLENDLWDEWGVELVFVKVLAHSNDVGNDFADRLARYGALKCNQGTYRVFPVDDISRLP